MVLFNRNIKVKVETIETASRGGGGGYIDIVEQNLQEKMSLKQALVWMWFINLFMRSFVSLLFPIIISLPSSRGITKFGKLGMLGEKAKIIFKDAGLAMVLILLSQETQFELVCKLFFSFDCTYPEIKRSSWEWLITFIAICKRMPFKSIGISAWLFPRLHYLGFFKNTILLFSFAESRRHIFHPKCVISQSSRNLFTDSLLRVSLHFWEVLGTPGPFSKTQVKSFHICHCAFETWIKRRNDKEYCKVKFVKRCQFRQCCHFWCATEPFWVVLIYF